MLEASGQIGGAYYVSTEGESLERGESMSVHVKFSNPSNQPISFMPMVEVPAGSALKAAQCDN